MINPNQKDWSLRLNDALWAYRTAFKMSLKMLPYWLVYDKPCGKPYHLLVELEHKSFWAIKVFNSNLGDADYVQKLQLNELEELRNDVYENSRIKVNGLHLFPGKVKLKQSGSFVVKNVYSYVAIEIKNPNNDVIFKVNG